MTTERRNKNMETKTREMEKEKLKLLKESTPICVFCKDNYNLIKHLILKNSYVGKELRCENCQSVYLKESEEYMPFDEKKEIEKENSEKEEKIWCDRCNDKFEKTHSCFKQNSEKEIKDLFIETEKEIEKEIGEENGNNF